MLHLKGVAIIAALNQYIQCIWDYKFECYLDDEYHFQMQTTIVLPSMYTFYLLFVFYSGTFS